jgi:VWFA-related protein
MRITKLLIVPFVVLTGLVAGAQQPPQSAPQPPPPTFKVEVNYVEIDAVVTDPQGRVIGDLTKDEFQVVEEGTPQSITAFARVDVPVERQDAPLFKRTAIEPDVRSNVDAFTGRVFVVVLDDLQTDFRRTPRVRAAARLFLERYVGANDMVAVVTTGGTARGGQEFTSSRTRLLAAVDRFMGQKRVRSTLDFERSMNARNTYSTLRSVAEYLGAVRGRRKAVVWFGEGVDYNIDNAFVSRDADTVRREMQDAIAAASRANVSFYGIDPRGLGAGLDDAIEAGAPSAPNASPFTEIQDEVRRGQDSLRIVSEETGGFAAVNQNELNTAFERIIEENSRYYVLAYYASNAKRDGRFRNVQVRVTRPGLTVRARKGYVGPRGKPASTTAAAFGDAKMPPEIREALASPVPVRGLGLRMFAAPFAGAGSKASVAVVLEIAPEALKFIEKNGTFNEDLEVHMLAIDGNGKVQGGARDVAPLRLRTATHEATTRHGFRITRRLQLPPNRYQLHVAVRALNGGVLGTLRHDIDVPDFSKGPLHMSGIALTSASAVRMPTANPDAEFKQVLPSEPVAIRDFPRADTVALFVEIYDNQPGTPHRVAIKTTLTAEDGRVMFTAADERGSEELQGKSGGYGYTANIPLSEMAPGRYVLQVEARTLLARSATAMRELELRVQ